MKRIVLALALVAPLAGCMSSPPVEQRVLIRTDGQLMRENPMLEQQYQIDHAVCIGEGQRAGLAAAPVYTTGILDAAIVANVREGQMTDVFVGCMAGRGYALVPLSQVEAQAAAFKAAAAAGAVGTKPAGSK